MWALCAVSGLTLAVHAWTLKRWARGWKQAARAASHDDAPSQKPSTAQGFFAYAMLKLKV